MKLALVLVASLVLPGCWLAWASTVPSSPPDAGRPASETCDVPQVGCPLRSTR